MSSSLALTSLNKRFDILLNSLYISNASFNSIESASALFMLLLVAVLVFDDDDEVEEDNLGDESGDVDEADIGDEELLVDDGENEKYDESLVLLFLFDGAVAVVDALDDFALLLLP